jgi:hypothetical protein
MMRKLTQLRIDEVSSVDKGAGEGVKVMLYKRDVPRGPQGPLLFNDIIRKAAEPDGDDEPSTADLSATLDELTAEIVASSTPHHINPMRARRWLLTTPSGQALLLQRTKKKETPMLDFAKLLEITEHGLNAQVTPRDGESFAKAFSRKYETDEAYRRQWQNHQDTKMMLSKATSASMTPTTAVVGNTLVADDSAEAVRQLTAMAEQTGTSFEVVFSAPENKELAARTYTMHNTPNVSSTSGSELQR